MFKHLNPVPRAQMHQKTAACLFHHRVIAHTIETSLERQGDRLSVMFTLQFAVEIGESNISWNAISSPQLYVRSGHSSHQNSRGKAQKAR